MSMKPKASNKIYNLNEAREKIRAFCAYRERSQVEVREKLYQYGLIPEVVDELIVELIQENFLSEERFACAFVRGKFQIKKWGRNKIRQELYRHQLSDYILKKAFAEIDEDAYIQCLRQVLEKKRRETRQRNQFMQNQKVAQYAIRRGFEPDLVWDVIHDESANQ